MKRSKTVPHSGIKVLVGSLITGRRRRFRRHLAEAISFREEMHKG